MESQMITAETIGDGEDQKILLKVKDITVSTTRKAILTSFEKRNGDSLIIEFSTENPTDVSKKRHHSTGEADERHSKRIKESESFCQSTLTNAGGHCTSQSSTSSDQGNSTTNFNRLKGIKPVISWKSLCCIPLLKLNKKIIQKAATQASSAEQEILDAEEKLIPKFNFKNIKFPYAFQKVNHEHDGNVNADKDDKDMLNQEQDAAQKAKKEEQSDQHVTIGEKAPKSQIEPDEVIFVMKINSNSNESLDSDSPLVIEEFPITTNSRRSSIEIDPVIRKINSMKCGDDAMKAGDFDSALKSYFDALHTAETNRALNAETHSKIASIYAKREVFEEAVSHCSHAIKEDPSAHKIFIQRGDVFYHLKQFKEAVADYEHFYNLTGVRDKLKRARAELEAMQKKKSHYDTLGVTHNATSVEIRKAYLQRAKEHHPDRHASADKETQKEEADKFKAVTEAYGVLSDVNQRFFYDQHQRRPASGYHCGSNFGFSTSFKRF